MSDEQATAPMNEAQVEEALFQKMTGGAANEDEPEVDPDEELVDEPAEEAPETEAATEETPADEAPATEDDTDYEFNGKVYKVPKELVEGALRQQDYTAKTQELAEMRKFVASQKQALEFEAEASKTLAPALTQLQNIDQMIAGMRGQAPDPSQDPIGYIQFNKQLSDLREARQELGAEVDKARTELAKQKQVATSELLRAGMATLAKNIPNWGAQTQQEVAKHMLGIGYVPAELEHATDPRLVQLAWESAQYRKLKAEMANVAKKKVAAAPTPVVKPSGNNVSQSQRSAKTIDALKERAMKSGRAEDVENALTARLMQARRATKR